MIKKYFSQPYLPERIYLINVLLCRRIINSRDAYCVFLKISLRHCHKDNLCDVRSDVSAILHLRSWHQHDVMLREHLFGCMVMIQAVSSAISVGLDDGKNFILLDTRTHVPGLNWGTKAIESALSDTMNGYIQEKWSFVIQTIIILQNNQKQIQKKTVVCWWLEFGKS